MDASPHRSAGERWPQFSLRTMLLLVTAVCVFVYVDPLGWQLPAPVPMKTVADGQTAEVDVIELNHRYFDAAERPRYRDDHFDQVLFWSIHADGKLHLRDWRIVKHPSMVPTRHQGKWVCTWVEKGIERRLEAPSFRETESKSAKSDPELLDRQSLPRAARVSLWHRTQPSVRARLAAQAIPGP